MNSLITDASNPDLELDDNKNYYDELVGDGKKFKTKEDLAKGDYHASMTVEVLKRKLDQLRNDYDETRKENMSRAKLEELIDKLGNNKLASNEDTLVNEVKNKPEFDLTQIKSLVSEEIKQNERSRREQANFNLVESKIKERFGNGSNEFLKQQMDILKLDVDGLNSLAKSNPELLIRSLGLDVPVKQEGFQAPPRTNNAFSPKGPQKRTWSYYQELKKSNPQLYYDPKNNRQMIADHLAQGEAFEDGDFHRFG